MIADTLQKIVENSPGAQGAILVDADGIVIDQFAGESTIDLESMAQELSARLLALRQMAESLEMGDLREFVLKADNATLAVYFLNNNMFAVLVLGAVANLGKGRWKLRSAAVSLNSEL